MRPQALFLGLVLIASSCRWSTTRIKTNYRPCEITLGDSYEDVEECLGKLRKVEDDTVDPILRPVDYDCEKWPLRFLLSFGSNNELTGFNAVFYGNTTDTMRIIELMDTYFSGLKSFYKKHQFKSEGDDTYIKKLDINRPVNTLNYRVEVVP